jgi:RNA polymerase sigma factor (sigma-70 family)
VTESNAQVQRQLHQLLVTGSAVGLTDGQLQERFATTARGSNDAAEAAFETIVSRHGPMVLTVCRQVLGDAHAAEDAFQATFLVLVRRAATLRVREQRSLGPWLYGVAYRTALKARKGAARRRVREERVAMPEARSEQVVAALEREDIGAALHQEVGWLPAKYRAAVVLCYFEGRTHDEAAAALQWPVGTVRSYLARARDLLRGRLARRGLAPAGLIAASLLEPGVRAEVPAPLLAATVATVIKGTPAASGVAVLADIVSKSIFVARITIVGAVLSLVVTATGLGLVLRGNFASPSQYSLDPAPAALAQSRPLDRHVDPLPMHARTRLGTSRFHAGSSINQAIHTHDGKAIVAIDANHVVRVWDADSGRIVREIGDLKLDFRDIAVSPDGKTLATVEQPARLRLWDIASGRERRHWHEARDEEYEHVRFSPDGRTIAVGVGRFDANTDKSESYIALWDTIATTERCHRIAGDWLNLWDLEFSRDGKTLATATRDTDVRRGDVLIGPDKSSTRIWDIASGLEQSRFPVDRCDVWSLAFSPDGKSLACGVSDGTVRFHDLATAGELEPRLLPEPTFPPKLPADEGRPVRGQPRGIGCLAFSPDGSILAGGTSGVYEGDFSPAPIQLWDVARRKKLHEIRAHQRNVASLSFAPDGKTLASSGGEPMIRLWHVNTGKETFPQSGHRTAVGSLAISPFDGTIFTGGEDGSVRQWDAASGRELGLIAQLTGAVTAMAIAPDGKTLVIGGGGEGFGAKPIYLWSVAERREIRRLARIEEREQVDYVAFAPDGKTVASERRVWDAVSGSVLATFRERGQQNEPYANYNPLFYTPDGRQIITAEHDGARLWDIAGDAQVRRAVEWKNEHCLATLSPDGRFLATRGPVDYSRAEPSDPPVILYELASGQQAATLEVQEGENFLCNPFSPDGRFLASATDARGPTHGSTVRVWDLATGRELRRFEGHLGRVKALAFTPDGRSVVSGSEDATALVWDVSDLKNSLKPGAPLSPQSLPACWNELASGDARAAYRAGWALSVPSAVPFLRDHLRPAASAEQGRAAPITSPEVLRTLRAIASLERINTRASRGVIELLAQGNPDAIATREAKSTCDRLTRMTRLSTFQAR